MMRLIAMYAGFPILFFGLVSLAFSAVNQGMNILEVGGMLIFVASVFVLGLEKFVPYYPRWNCPGRDLWVDALYFVTNLIANTLIMLALPLLILKGVQLIGLTSLWPNHWPLVWQVVVGIMIVDFVGYWYHRVSHEYDTVLRRMHHIHHSIRRLYFFNGYRLHVGDIGLTIILSLAPLFILGINDTALGLISFTMALHNIFAHSNVDFRIGPLTWLFSMNQLHRWHHSYKYAEANSNYGGCLIIFDVLFRTRFLPDRKMEEGGLGIYTPGGVFKENFLWQFRFPFSKKMDH